MSADDMKVLIEIFTILKKWRDEEDAKKNYRTTKTIAFEPKII